MAADRVRGRVASAGRPFRKPSGDSMGADGSGEVAGFESRSRSHAGRLTGEFRRGNEDQSGRSNGFEERRLEEQLFFPDPPVDLAIGERSVAADQGRVQVAGVAGELE